MIILLFEVFDTTIGTNTWFAEFDDAQRYLNSISTGLITVHALPLPASARELAERLNGDVPTAYQHLIEKKGELAHA